MFISKRTVQSTIRLGTKESFELGMVFRKAMPQYKIMLLSKIFETYEAN